MKAGIDSLEMGSVVVVLLLPISSLGKQRFKILLIGHASSKIGIGKLSPELVLEGYVVTVVEFGHGWSRRRGSRLVQPTIQAKGPVSRACNNCSQSRLPAWWLLTVHDGDPTVLQHEG